jgi:glucose-1-phosphate thymidylyltransferase
MQVVIFEDQRVPQLYPATIGRAACAISCGSYNLVELLAPLGKLHVVVRPHLTEMLTADGWNVGVPSAVRDGLVLVNARLVPSVASLNEVKRIIAAGRGGVVKQGEVIVLAIAPTGKVPADLKADGLDRWAQSLEPLAANVELPMFDYPHDIVRHHLTTLESNLAHRLANGVFEEVADGVFLGAGAKLGQYVVTDTSAGPIVLDEGATVGPYCYMSGPSYLGRGSRVLEHAAIKDGVALGHTTKVGGEVECSILEPYTNKQHHGFMGHSYLGSWVNLGAGTCNSDLKNTYGQVHMDYHGRSVPTGMQFLGCIIGDYAKSAINTGIFTGKTVGVCSMLYGFVTTNVPSFVNYARLFGQVTEASVEVMIKAQARMFARRNVEQRPCDIQLLHNMYELTRHERQIAGEPLSL